MKKTLQILAYNFNDVLRSRWMIFYIGFFLLSGFGLLYFSSDLHKAIVSLNNIIIAIIPLISIVFGAMYYYNSREFAELLLSQPVKRRSIFLGQYLGLSASLGLSFATGLLVPFLYYGITQSAAILDFFVLLFTGVILTFIFTGLAFLISSMNEDRIKGFGLSILVWLILAVIYDGLVLVSMVVFEEYPLEKAAIVMSLLNPVDLSRILVLLKLDISALMGFTGASFRKFFGNGPGMVISGLSLLLWIVIPVSGFILHSRKKDF